MYKVLLDGTLLCDPRIEELALISPVVNLEENKAGSFSFTVPPAHPRINDFKRRKSVVQVWQDDELVFAGMCIEVRTDFYKQKTVYCEGELAYFNDSIQRPERYQGMTVRGLLEAYINNHNAQVEEEKQFSVGMVTVTDSNNSIYCYTNMESTMECLKSDLVDDLGGYFRIRHDNGIKYIDYLADSMNTNEQIIKLGVNLLNFNSNIDSTDIATAIIPLGAKLDESEVEGLETRLDIKSVNGGLDYVCSEEAVEEYGWIYKTIEFDNVNSASILKRKGEQYLQETQFETVVIEATALDLHVANPEIERFKISDKIRIVSDPHGLDKYFRLTKQTIYLDNPENDQITLGSTEKATLSAKSVQISDEIKKAIESIVPVSTILNQAQDNASLLLNGNGENGHVVLHQNDKGVVYEILVMDTADIDTATKIWRWNQKGLGYANSKDASGNWKFDLAMTMDGQIVANRITTGIMSADRIRGGSLEVGGTGYARNGKIIVYNEDNDEIAKFNKSGAHINGSVRAEGTYKSHECFIDVNQGIIEGGVDDETTGLLAFRSWANGKASARLHGYNSIVLTAPKIWVGNDSDEEQTVWKTFTGELEFETADGQYITLAFKNGLCM